MRSQTNSKAVEAIRAADAAWMKVYAAKDLDKSVAFCDEQGSVLVPNAPIATGKKAIAKLIAAGLALQGYKLVWHAGYGHNLCAIQFGTSP